MRVRIVCAPVQRARRGESDRATTDAACGEQEPLDISPLISYACDFASAQETLTRHDMAISVLSQASIMGLCGK